MNVLKKLTVFDTDILMVNKQEVLLYCTSLIPDKKEKQLVTGHMNTRGFLHSST